MSDIETVITQGGGLDWKIQQPGLSVELGLDSAILLSLFTDRRAEDGDGVSLKEGRRGWWADSFSDPGDHFGSRLWLLKREPLTQEAAVKAKGYTLEALQWLIDDQIASRVEVAAELRGRSTLVIDVQIWRPDGADSRHQFEQLWGK